MGKRRDESAGSRTEGQTIPECVGGKPNSGDGAGSSDRDEELGICQPSGATSNGTRDENGVSLNLIRATIAGDPQAAHKLRKRVFDKVSEAGSMEDLAELNLALSALASVSFSSQEVQQKQKPRASLIAVDSGELFLQIWTNLDGSDSETRPLNDLEKALVLRFARMHK